eukprot:764873-Prymnesium_polylepis.1
MGSAGEKGVAVVGPRVGAHLAPRDGLARLGAHRGGHVAHPVLEQQEEAVAALAQPLAPVAPAQHAFR